MLSGVLLWRRTLQDSPAIGDFVEVRGRPWLVEGIDDKDEGLSALQLSCISDDAQGEALEVAWEAEIGARRLEGDFWARLGRDGADNPAIFAAYLRTLKWHTRLRRIGTCCRHRSAPAFGSSPISSCHCGRHSGGRGSIS
jgi:hypothetical protein